MSVGGRHTRIRTGLGAVALALSALALAVPASAVALTESSNTVTATGTHSAIAPCPPGKHVVSGGGWVHLTPATLAQLPLNDTGASGNGWSATGFTHDPNHPFAVTAYAYCSTHDPHLQTFTGSPTTNTPSTPAVVSCTAGNAISGGGDMTGSYGYTFAFAKLGNGWRTGSNSKFDGGSGGTLPTTAQASVNCTPERYVLTTASQSGTIAPDHLLDRTATCPPGTAVVSGGGDAGTNGFMYYSRMKGNGWTIDAESGALDSTTVTAYAYCIRLPTTTITTFHVKSKKRRASFSFTGTTGEGSPSFQCRLDQNPFAACTSPKTYTQLKVGTHTFTVRALDPSGRADPTPAVKSFRIVKKKKKKH